jgi:hypothetical protein
MRIHRVEGRPKQLTCVLDHKQEVAWISSDLPDSFGANIDRRVRGFSSNRASAVIPCVVGFAGYLYVLRRMS